MMVAYVDEFGDRFRAGIGRGRVTDVMREPGVRGVRRGGTPVTARPARGAGGGPGLVERGFEAGAPNRLHRSSGCRTLERTEPGITRTKRRKPPHYKSGTKNRPYHPVSLLQRFKAISESVGASDGGTAKDKFFAEIDGPLDDRYVGLLTDGSNGAYGYSGVEPSEETKKAACQALAEFIY